MCKQTHLFNALLAEAVQAFHERMCLAHDRQADGARELGVQEARRNARTVVGVRDHRAPCQNKKNKEQVSILNIQSREASSLTEKIYKKKKLSRVSGLVHLPRKDTTPGTFQNALAGFVDAPDTNLASLACSDPFFC